MGVGGGGYPDSTQMGLYKCVVGRSGGIWKHDRNAESVDLGASPHVLLGCDFAGLWGTTVSLPWDVIHSYYPKYLCTTAEHTHYLEVPYPVCIYCSTLRSTCA